MFLEIADGAGDVVLMLLGIFQLTWLVVLLEMLVPAGGGAADVINSCEGVHN